MKFLAFSQRIILGSSLSLPAHGRVGARATSLLVAHFALQNTKFGSEKGKVQNPARIPPQTPPAGGKKAEAGQFHSPRKIVCPAESKLVFRIFVKKCDSWRRDRDSNPRYSLTHTHAFQACAFDHSATSPD